MDDHIDFDVLRNIENMDLSLAIETSVTIIEHSKTKQSKKHALIYDIREAPTSREVSRIMWNAALAGQGLHTTNSRWQKAYK